MLGAPRAASVWLSERLRDSPRRLDALTFQRQRPGAVVLKPPKLRPVLCTGPLVQRIVNKLDFERLLATRSRSRSTHFAVHHVAEGPAQPVVRIKRAASEHLSTDHAPGCPQPVDDLSPHQPRSAPTPAARWLGCVVPKRHARRAVTRSLLKRQLRGVFVKHAPDLPAGLWLIRLRAPFAKTEFVSASSKALALAAWQELDGLLTRAVA
jgi:ribonuclease P protein component